MDDPFLTRVSTARGGTGVLIFINGMLTKRKFGPPKVSRWVRAARGAGWKGSIEHLWWDSSRAKGLLKARNTWKTVKRRAEEVGEQWLEHLLDALGAPQVTLIGHSLGARVIHSGLLAGAAHGRVQDVILLGGAVKRKNRDWKLASRAIRGQLVNVYNRHDEVLGGSRLTFTKTNFCGRKKITAKSSAIFNFDATKLLDSTDHWVKTYLKALPAAVRAANLKW